MSGFMLGLCVCAVLFAFTLWALFAVGGRGERR